MENKVYEILKECGVLQEGHFVLTSGKHSAQYMQCARVFQYPEHTIELSKMIAEKFKDQNIDLVVGPAVGEISLHIK